MTDFLDKYPKTKQAMEEMSMSLDEVFAWSEKEINKLKSK